MIVFLTILLMIAVAGFAWELATVITCDRLELTTIIGTTLSLISVITLMFLVYHYSKPTAMDVYQGKTTLQYTTINYGYNVYTDSVVVFKPNTK